MRRSGRCTCPKPPAGSGTLTYSLGPKIPPGLTFDPISRKLSGTPTGTGSYPMTYTVRDSQNRTDALEFDITVETFSLIRSIVAAIDVEGAAGVPRFEEVPEPGDGPAVGVTGNHFYVAGGSVFLDIEPEPGASVDKLLLSIGDESFGYYEVDLPGGAASHRLVGRVQFDLDPPAPGCLLVSVVDAGGAVGPPTCHLVIGIPVDFSDVQVTVSWDTDADLDLHVADPTGHEVYFGSRVVESGGRLFPDSDDCEPDNIRNERIAWTEGTPPPGLYEVRLSHFDSCDAEETNYILTVYNHGHTTTFSGTFTGPGGDSARGTGRVITRFEVPGDAPAEAPAKAISSTYRGSGDQVFVLNPNGEALADTLYTLNLGSASAEVYVIATAGNYHMDPQVDRLDLREAAAKGRRATAQEDHQPEPRPSAGEVSPRLQWITELNNFSDGPPVWDGSVDPARIQELQARPAVAEGDRVRFVDLVGLQFVAATVRRVVTDGTTSVALWVADREWEATCASRGDCVTQEMVDAVADRFVRPGASNDIYDWVTTIFGDPWGTHGNPMLIPPVDRRDSHPAVRHRG